MSESDLLKAQREKCVEAFDRQMKKDEERERNYMTYDELREAIEEVLKIKFKRDNIFFKMVSELDNVEPNRVGVSTTNF